MAVRLKFVLEALLLVGVAEGVLATAVAQTAVVQSGEVSAVDGNRIPLAFEVVSIRPSKPGGGAQQIGPTADGYRMRNLFMVFPILTAYVPTGGGSAHYAEDQTAGFPDWVNNDAYDIDAKVAEVDLEKWQNPASQPAMLRTMLQAMLADRLKLVVHRGSKEGPMYALVTGKDGPKFKPADPNEQHAGFSLPGGGVLSSEVKDGEYVTHFYGFSMAMLAASLSGKAERPVVDKTGLRGRYDVTERSAAPACAPHCGEHGDTQSPDETSVSSIAEELGLKLEPIKGRIETLVLDHVERPSEN